MNNYEAARERLATIAAEVNALSDFNEATARFQIIDRILTEVFGWNRAGVIVERYERGDYTDYECGRPARMLVEAKRDSIGFELPISLDAGVIKIATLIDDNSAFEHAVEQAIGYCQSRNIQYAAVTNGKQWAFFLGSRTDAIPSINGSCIAFESLESMKTRFREAWDLVTPAALDEGRLGALLVKASLPPPPTKLSARLPGYPGHKNRNPIATELQILGGLFFEDIVSSPELEETFLHDAYCQSGALSQYALVSKELLQTRYTTFFENQTGVSVSPATNKKGTSSELTADVLAASLSKRPILLVGDVGVGKTTFIRNLIKVGAKEELERSLVLYVDYVAKPAVADDIKGYTATEIIRQLRENYDLDIYERQFVRGVYNRRLEDFQRGIFADLKDADPKMFLLKEIEFIELLTANREEHLRLSLEHIFRGRKRQIVVFLDNVDQRRASFQEEVFMISASIAASWPVTAFVSLRPETFSLSRARGALAAYQPRVFTIEPPRIDLVIKKRLQFALTQLRHSGGLPGLPYGASIESKNLENYLLMLIKAFDSQEEIIEFIDNMCSGNVREALKYVGSFVGSGHVDSGKILQVMGRSGNYLLPLHEFLRAVIYKDAEYYDPTNSPIPNLFDLVSTSGAGHFALPILLEYVERAGQIGGSHGFVEHDAVLAYMQSAGFSAEQTLPQMRRAFEKGLVSSPEGLKDEATGRLRITSAGAYCRKKLCALFPYIDAIVVDTPVTDPTFRTSIHDARTIEERLSRAVLFLDYLDACWADATILRDKFDWHVLSGDARRQIKLVKDKLNIA